jgi:hypothetical protein
MTSPAQPRTPLVLLTRSITINLVRAWASLSAANRTLWNNYAADHPLVDWTGVARRVTGANWFAGLNFRRIFIGAVQVDTPPIVSAPAAPLAFSAANGILQSVVTWTPLPGTNLLLDLWSYGPHSAGFNAPLTKARHRLLPNGETGTVTVSGLRPGRYTFFGRAYSEDDGQVSIWTSDTADITAA